MHECEAWKSSGTRADRFCHQAPKSGSDRCGTHQGQPHWTDDPRGGYGRARAAEAPGSAPVDEVPPLGGSGGDSESCEGTCTASEHRGAVHAYCVTGGALGSDGLILNYCDAAVEDDRREGLAVRLVAEAPLSGGEVSRRAAAHGLSIEASPDHVLRLLPVDVASAVRRGIPDKPEGSWTVVLEHPTFGLHRRRDVPAQRLKDVALVLIAELDDPTTRLCRYCENEIDGDSEGDADGATHAGPCPCADCGRPIGYSHADEAWHHFSEPERGCFLIPAEDAVPADLTD